MFIRIHTHPAFHILGTMFRCQTQTHKLLNIEIYDVRRLFDICNIVIEIMNYDSSPQGSMARQF